jgi:hypothetical protein
LADRPRIAYHSVILRAKKPLRLINGYLKIGDLQVGMGIHWTFKQKIKQNFNFS